MMKYKLFIFLFTGILSFYSCNTSQDETHKLSHNAAEQLLNYLEENGNYVNSDNIPSLIDATKLYESLDDNILVIDLRTQDQYTKGHVKGALNIAADSILFFFENIIEPNSFDKIIMVCEIGSRSAYVTGLLRLLGYDNVFSLRFGLSSWSKNIANNKWLYNLSSALEGQLETQSNPKPEKGELPLLSTLKEHPYDILKERVSLLLKEDISKTFVSLEDISHDYKAFYLINYWPLNLYEQGHLPGAVQYTPKKAFHSTEDLLTIPTNKPVIVYCFTGQHSSFAVAFLRVLGYDAYSMRYGTNAFIYETMKATQRASRVFSEEHIKDFPLDTKEKTIEPELNKPISVPIQGGC